MLDEHAFQETKRLGTPTQQTRTDTHNFQRWSLRKIPMFRSINQCQYTVTVSTGNNGELTAVWDRLQTETSCCGLTGPAEFSNTSGRWDMMPASCCLEPPGPNSTRCARPFASGCEERLLAYLRGTASLLAILGYCVLAFLKLCFLGILR